MTTADYLKRLEPAGFTFVKLWDLADKVSRVSGWAVYGTKGALLGSLMIREEKRGGITVAETWESIAIADDLTRLKALDLRAEGRIKAEAGGRVGG